MDDIRLTVPAEPSRAGGTLLAIAAAFFVLFGTMFMTASVAALCTAGFGLVLGACSFFAFRRVRRIRRIQTAILARQGISI